MTAIAIYVEGGGDKTTQKAELRLGFDSLLNPVKSMAREKGLGWKLVLGGSRRETYEAFIHAVTTNPEVINALLVDAEEPFANAAGNAVPPAVARVGHLRRRDAWDLSAVAPERVHLMVQCMEAWIVADVDALGQFYGQHFRPKVKPR